MALIQPNTSRILVAGYSFLVAAEFQCVIISKPHDRVACQPSWPTSGVAPPPSSVLARHLYLSCHITGVSLHKLPVATPIVQGSHDPEKKSIYRKANIRWGAITTASVCDTSSALLSLDATENGNWNSWIHCRLVMGDSRIAPN